MKEEITIDNAIHLFNQAVNAETFDIGCTYYYAGFITLIGIFLSEVW